MFSGKLAVMSCVAITTAVGLLASAPAGFGRSPASGFSRSPSQVEGRVACAPIQSISYRFGSKAMSGYFVRQVQQAATCAVTLMIIENGDAEQPLKPARLRLVLYPGQTAGLDSAEGRSLNLTCGTSATALLVDLCDAGTRGTPGSYRWEQRCQGA
jgi:hypothetical protein